MGKLNTAPSMENADDFYAALLELHAERSATESAEINSRLILLLANHIGDIAVLHEAMKFAVIGAAKD